MQREDMQALDHGLISRSSSATLSMAQRSSYPNDISDDISIAQGLMNNQRAAVKRPSFASTNRHGIDGSLFADDSFDAQSVSVAVKPSRRALVSSNTWTTSSGELLSDQDEIDDRSAFVHEFNRLARKHGVRIMVPEDYETYNEESLLLDGKPPSWFTRKILRRTSSSQSGKQKPERQIKHRRSISDISLRLKLKKDKLKDKDLQDLVRLCGASLFYLPAEYAAGSLTVPTCFRATAQYLVQNALTARGIFRISGSHSTVTALYNHYCTLDEEGEVISGTVRCPVLPEHIKCDVHDVASAFKKFISGLPGGILGSLPIFDSLVSIQSQLQGGPDMTRTKMSKVRSRLIALAISTLRSQYRRELICAVFGLLCYIGRAAEQERREDERGRPLPTSDLMGYGPLGIIFGPLLVGDLLDNYSMRLANPHGGLILLPISPPKSRKEKNKEKGRKSKKSTEDGTEFNTFVDKLKVANGITEMLIANWRDVVRHLRSLSGLRPLSGHKSLGAGNLKQPFLRPSASDTFALRKPPDWDDMRSPIRRAERSISPTPTRRINGPSPIRTVDDSSPRPNDTLHVRKQRSRPRPMSSQMLSGARSLSILSPTVEEQSRNNSAEKAPPVLARSEFSSTPRTIDKENANPLPASESSVLSRKDRSSDTPSSRTKLHKERPGHKRLEKSHKTPSSSQKEVVAPVPGSNSTETPKCKAKLKKTTAASFKSRSWEEDHSQTSIAYQGITHLQDLPQVTSSTSRIPKPDITVSRASSTVPEGTVSNQVRRIAASEPGHAPPPLASSRRISKSCFGDLRGGAMTGGPAMAKVKDPLSRVSNADDLASLATLAEALNKEPSIDQIKTSEDLHPKPHISNSVIEQTADPKNQRIASDQSGKITRRYAISNPSPGYPILQEAPVQKPSPTFYKHLPAELNTSSNETVITRPPAFKGTPTRKVLEESPFKRYNSPAGSVKALAARFNNADAGSPLAPSTTISPSKALFGQSRSRYETPKDALIAPYTTNPTTPTKSQKSSKSEKTPQSRKSQPQEKFPVLQTDGSSIRKLTPWRIPKSTKGDSDPLKPVRKSFESLTTTQTNPVNVLTRQQTAPVHKLSTSLAVSTKPSAETLCKSPFTNFAPLKPFDLSTSRDGPSSIDASDGTVVPLRLGTVLPIPDPAPVAHHVHFTRPSSLVSEETPHSINLQLDVQDSIPISNVNSLSKPTHMRSNSLLHTQIRSLQKQVTEKSEEIRQLKRQLEVRSISDIGTIGEQLREAERRLQMWKSRAEIAEKQLELLTKVPSRSNSGQNARQPMNLRYPEEIITTSTDYSEDASRITERIRRALHGMDGAASLEEWNSEETTDTVVRDIREAVTGSEYSIWVEQTKWALENATAQETT